MPLLQTLLRLTNYRSALLRTVVPSIATAYALQGIVAVPSILAESERFYDLSGSLTYLSVTALSLALPTLRARGVISGGVGGGGWTPNWRQLAVSGAVAVWAIRCMSMSRARAYHWLMFCTVGSYLFARVVSDGKDSRFDEIKKHPPSFLAAFVAQATWVSLCTLPVLALNALPPQAFARLSTGVLLTDVVGAVLFLAGFSLEVAADRQKAQWLAARKRKLHDEHFLSTGLWARCRYPNYFGESLLWVGIAVATGGVLVRSAGPALVPRVLAAGMAAASPAFVTFLLLKVSGVPLSEKKYDAKYGDRKDYQVCTVVRHTSVANASWAGMEEEYAHVYSKAVVGSSLLKSQLRLRVYHPWS